MSYRGSSQFHKIRKIVGSTNKTGEVFGITLTKAAVKQFDGFVLVETITEKGILLTKSGCDMNEKVTMVIGQPNNVNRVCNNHEKYFERIDK